MLAARRLSSVKSRGMIYAKSPLGSAGRAWRIMHLARTGLNPHYPRRKSLDRSVGLSTLRTLSTGPPRMVPSTSARLSVFRLA